jgi:hypothetical protein
MRSTELRRFEFVMLGCGFEFEFGTSKAKTQKLSRAKARVLPPTQAKASHTMKLPSAPAPTLQNTRINCAIASAVSCPVTKSLGE